MRCLTYKVLDEALSTPDLEISFETGHSEIDMMYPLQNYVM